LRLNQPANAPVLPTTVTSAAARAGQSGLAGRAGWQGGRGGAGQRRWERTLPRFLLRAHAHEYVRVRAHEAGQRDDEVCQHAGHHVGQGARGGAHRLVAAALALIRLGPCLVRDALVVQCRVPGGGLEAVGARLVLRDAHHHRSQIVARPAGRGGRCRSLPGRCRRGMHARADVWGRALSHAPTRVRVRFRIICLRATRVAPPRPAPHMRRPHLTRLAPLMMSGLLAHRLVRRLLRRRGPVRTADAVDGDLRLGARARRRSVIWAASSARSRPMWYERRDACLVALGLVALGPAARPRPCPRRRPEFAVLLTSAADRPLLPTEELPVLPPVTRRHQGPARDLMSAGDR
jgi:hypothetical protein